MKSREREHLIDLKFSNAAGGYDNQLLELRIDRVLKSLQTPVLLETREVKLLQSLRSDFVDLWCP